jgi:hypothetical protein
MVIYVRKVFSILGSFLKNILSSTSTPISPMVDLENLHLMI